MSAEDLYREMAEQESRDDARFDQRYAIREIQKVSPKGPDTEKARERYEKEIAPVLEARRRLAAGLPPTDNPFVNLWLKMTGKDKAEDLPQTEIVDRSKSFGLVGPSVEDIQKVIASDPDKFRDLARNAPEVRPVQVNRKTPDDLIQDAIQRADHA